MATQASILPNGKQQYFTTPGVPAVGYKLATFASGTSNPQATWADAGKVAANTNPIILDARGEALIYWDGVYKVQLQDSTGAVIWTVDPMQSLPILDGSLIPTVDNTFDLGSTAFSWRNLYLGAGDAAAYNATSGNIGYYKQTAEEAAALITPTDFTYYPGNVLRYGADRTGALDSTAAINNALSCNGTVYVPNGTYVCSAPLNMISGQVLYGDGPKTVLQFASGIVNNIVMSGITGATVRDLKVLVTGVVGGSTVGAVYLLNATACRVFRCEFQGMWGGGVFFDSGCSDCVIDSNYFHNFNAGGNFGDIMMYSQASTINGPVNNVIVNNQCFGGANAFGISFEDPDIATLVTGYPRKNLIMGNRVGIHATYGILLYMSGSIGTPPFGDTNNQIIGNYVEGILGNNFANTDSGAGIYCVGAGIGGTIIANNTVFNCCVNTTTASLAPAGIGLSLVHTGVTRPVISGNVISGMTQGQGILVVSSPGGAVVANNSIIMPSSNAGAGPGGASLLGRGISVNNSSSVNLTGNDVQMFGLGQALQIFASSGNITDFEVTGGYYSTSSLASSTQALQVTFGAAFTISRLNIANANFESNGANPCVSLAGVNVGTISLTANNAGTGVGLNVAGCTNLRFPSGFINSAGPLAISTSGTCTNCFMGKDLNWGNTTGATGSFMSNTGAGFNVEANFSSVPTAGSWVLGDRAFHLGNTVGNAKGWSRVTTGAGNVLATDWISEGNL